MRPEEGLSALLLCALLPPMCLAPCADGLVVPSVVVPSASLQKDSSINTFPSPEIPCGTDPIIVYPPLGSALVKAWSKSDSGQNWQPPACTGWTENGFSTLVTISARFSHGKRGEDLLRKVGAISELKGIHYWSASHKQWRTLVEGAYALANSPPSHRRPDFTPTEMKNGNVFYYEQTDNLAGEIIYRMTVLQASDSRLVFSVENVTTVRHSFIPLLHPSELQSIYFMERESDNVWRFYSIVRTGKRASRLIAGNESAAVNRAVAFYRYFVGIPMTQEPPAAR